MAKSLLDVIKSEYETIIGTLGSQNQEIYAPAFYNEKEQSDYLERSRLGLGRQGSLLNNPDNQRMLRLNAQLKGQNVFLIGWEKSQQGQIKKSLPASRTYVWEGQEASTVYDQAMKTETTMQKGGIDFTAPAVVLRQQNTGASIEPFKFDPLQLQQLQNAPGFEPVIINIQPLGDVRQFLGISTSVSTVNSSAV